MKVTTKKLTITIEDDEEIIISAKGLSSLATTAVGPISSCTKGHAVYAFRGTRTLQRVGGATCQSPAAGSSAASASSTLMITSTISSQLSALGTTHGEIREFRFAVCCPPPAGGISLAKTPKSRPKSKTAKPKAKKKAARKSTK